MMPSYTSLTVEQSIDIEKEKRAVGGFGNKSIALKNAAGSWNIPPQFKMTDQISFFDLPLNFDGVTYDPKHDAKRLGGQLAKVKEAMSSGNWFTLSELQAICGGSEAGISARIRDLRKAKFGSYTIESRRRGEANKGLFEYHLINQ